MAVGEARADFPALAHWVHLNSGGMAPMPRSVAAELLRIPRQVAEYGPALLQAHDEEFVRAQAAHATLARFLGAEVDEIAFTTQFSTGVSIVVEGLSWQAGDEIIVSDQEHPALLTPILNVARRRGVVVRRFAVSDDQAAMLGAVADLLNRRTRLLAISHVTTETGTFLPVAEMTRLAHEHGALALIDGAHTVGQIPLDLRALECDFYAFVGYKWLYGPYPSAALHIRRETLDQIEVTWTGSRVSTTAAIDMDSLDFVPGAARFEYGGRVFAHDSAMAEGVDYVQRLGLASIGAHQRRLAGHLHRALARLPGACIWSPPDPADGTGIVTFSLDGVDGRTLSDALRDRWRIVTRPALKGAAVRVSIAAFTNEADLDLLAEGAATVAAGR